MFNSSFISSSQNLENSDVLQQVNSETVVHPKCTADTLKPLIHNILEDSPENDAKWKKKIQKRLHAL